ncbi:MAG TPA: hypothetical protein VFR41_11515, partial [Acidimicrobiia bacterium]|nr:hypothetical protein [Acidimicrobiia bacterium]
LATYHLVVRALDGHHETTPAVLGVLAAVATAQLLTDTLVRRALLLSTQLSARERFAWLALAPSGILMALGYRGVGGNVDVYRSWEPLLAVPALLTWYAFEQMWRETVNFRQTVEAIALAPELAGLASPGHAERVAGLCVAVAETLGFRPDLVLEMATAGHLHHLGEVTLDHPDDGAEPTRADELARTTGEILHGIPAFNAASDIVAGNSTEPERQRGAQVLRMVSDYDDLTVVESMSAELAITTLRTARRYSYDPALIDVLELVVREQVYDQPWGREAQAPPWSRRVRVLATGK